MKSSTSDKIKGTGKIIKGKAQEAAGRASAKPNLRDKGIAKQAEGRIQKKAGDVKKIFDR